MKLAIQRIDTSQPSAAQEIQALCDKLSPAGNVVSEAGRQKTIEVFGEPLSPVAAVERICGEVQQQGLEAVLRYTDKLDGVECQLDSQPVGSPTNGPCNKRYNPILKSVCTGQYYV